MKGARGGGRKGRDGGTGGVKGRELKGEVEANGGQRGER